MRIRLSPRIMTLTVYFLLGATGYADTRHSYRLKPQDYLFGPAARNQEDIFQNMQLVDAGVNFNIGSDCGKISIEGTLRSAFTRLKDGNYFQGLISGIATGGPMLAACYFSPTWCAILKHTQLSANFLAQTRLNQCQIIDKYIDSRTEDYYRDRQACVRRNIQSSGGDMERALDSCNGGMLEKANAWAGQSQSNPNAPSELIADSAKWAGFTSDQSKRATDLIKSMVGDTVVNQGGMRVQFGPRPHAYSPRAHLSTLEKSITEDFCGKLIPELSRNNDQGGLLSDAEIGSRMDKLSHTHKIQNEIKLLTPELVRNLSYLPQARRNRICAKLSQAMAMVNFTRDMNDSLDILTVAAQNPNLPPNRQKEIDQKRTALRDQVELTLKLKQEQNKPIGEVMQYIAKEGLTAQDEASYEALSQDSSSRSNFSHYSRMNDCADGIFCESSDAGGY